MPYKMRGLGLLALLLFGGSAVAEFRYAASVSDEAVIIDSRPLEQCRAMSLPGARCLPADELLGPHRRLPSFRDILWVFGTAGLRGDETVLVAGAEPRERDFVAGLLYLAGQHEVIVLSEPLPRLLATGTAGAPGTQRGMVRDPIYRAAMREELVVLRDELWRELQGTHPPALLDGRSDHEYRGERVRAQRGGRLPGADSWPDRDLRALLARGTAALPPPSAVVVYGHDPLESLAYFTAVRAGGGFDARVYLQGWREWAAHGLPVDHETLPERASPTAAAPAPQPTALVTLNATRLILIGAAVTVMLLTVLFAVRRSHRWTS